MNIEDLRPGDLVFFHRLTLRQAGWRNLLGYISNLLIAFGQRISASDPQGLYNGFAELIHVAVVMQVGGKLCLVEWTFPRGCVITPLRERLTSYPGVIIVIPLAARYREQWRDTKADKWLELHQHDSYRLGGLLFAILHVWLGAPVPGALFCSESVINLYQYMGIMPVSLPVLRHGYYSLGAVNAHAYSPADTANLPQLARSAMARLSLGVAS